MQILRSRVDNFDYKTATEFVIERSKTYKNTRCHAANVHMIMEGYDDDKFQEVINSADLIVSDGMPLVWSLKLLGDQSATRVYGPTLTLAICAAAAQNGVPIGLYGGTNESLGDFKMFLQTNYPTIKIVCTIAPPFRSLTPEEDETYTQQILDSGARILFVGIGCPKQEWWMYNHRERLPLVMIGVGAAFDFHSGRVKQSPSFLQNIGLEWLFRLIMEPKRLWKRYAKHNPRFIALFAIQYLREKIVINKGV